MKGSIYTVSMGEDVVYVGSTINGIKTRWQSGHKTKFNGGLIEEVEIISITHKKELLQVEKYWIDQFRQWGFTLKNKINNASSVFPDNKICPLCNNCITNNNWTVVGDHKEHKDCQKPKKTYAVKKRGGVFLKEDIYNDVLSLAKDDSRSFNRMVEILLQQAIMHRKKQTSDESKT